MGRPNHLQLGEPGRAAWPINLFSKKNAPAETGALSLDL